jgi:hypothetical protein
MPDTVDGPLSPETLRRMASEQVGLALSDKEIEALRPLLNDLLTEIRRIRPADRAAAEPNVTFAAEAWPHD